MNIEDAPETEMLTRTSGEARLSDFILWQSDFAMLYFEPKNMPEVGLFDYVKAIIHYQILCQFDRITRQSHRRVEDARGKTQDAAQFLRQRMFLKRVETDRVSYLERLAVGDENSS
ncbi:dehydrodolichyl diphosphate synthase complex subunit DHDDS-like [Ixodes scapularis]